MPAGIKTYVLKLIKAASKLQSSVTNQGYFLPPGLQEVNALTLLGTKERDTHFL